MKQVSDTKRGVIGIDKEIKLILRKMKWPWILLAALLLLALLIPISRDVPLKLVEQGINSPAALAEVNFAYPTHWPYSNVNPETLKDTTDTLGEVVFHNIRRPLWAELFCRHDTATVSARNDCFMVECFADNIDNYPKTTCKTIPLHPIRDRIVFIVEDDEYHEPLPDVDVTAYIDDDTLHYTSDVSGAVEIIAPICTDIKVVANKEYYNPAATSGAVASFILGDVDARTLRLKTKYGSVKIIVRNLSNHEPLPGALVTLHATNNETDISKTNINGVAIAVFHKVRDNSDTIYFDAQKQPDFADTTLPKNIANFYIHDATENQRTMYLRPQKRTITFKNTDGQSPLSGVKNEIYANGKLDTVVYSNANGVFEYEVRPGVEISIVATKPGYAGNNTKVKNKTDKDLKDIGSRTIPLAKILPIPPRPPVSPCDAGMVVPRGNDEMFHVRSYKMGKKGGRTMISLDFDWEDDLITIYDGIDISSNGKVIIGHSNQGVTVGYRTPLNKQHIITFDFESDVITVVINTTSIKWQYQVHCPN